MPTFKTLNGFPLFRRVRRSLQLHPVLTMKELPIIFSAPMVRALLDGRKTQTRRIIKPQPAQWQAMVIDITPPFFNEEEGGWGQVETIWSGPLVPGMCEPEREEWRPLRLPYSVGDRLWVRETWQTGSTDNGPQISYRATPDYFQIDAWDGEDYGVGPSFNYEKTPSASFDFWLSDVLVNDGPWRSPIHMPRWASRITLEVTEVRVQRLQEISEEDARAEGIFKFFGIEVYGYDKKGKPARHAMDTARDTFAALWASIHGPDAWAANPWLAAISFKRIT